MLLGIEIYEDVTRQHELKIFDKNATYRDTTTDLEIKQLNADRRTVNRLSLSGGGSVPNGSPSKQQGGPSPAGPRRPSAPPRATPPRPPLDPSKLVRAALETTATVIGNAIEGATNEERDSDLTEADNAGGIYVDADGIRVRVPAVDETGGCILGRRAVTGGGIWICGGSSPDAGEDLPDLFDYFGVNPGVNLDLQSPSGADGRSYVTYAAVDEAGNVRYVGRASGLGTPEDVLKGRLSKGHHIFDEHPALKPWIVDVQSNPDANKGAEEFFVQGYQQRGAKLFNSGDSPPLGFSKTERGIKSTTRMDAFFEDLFGRT